MTGCGLEGWNLFLSGAGILVYATMFKLALGSTQPPVQWIAITLSETNNPLCKAYHSHLVPKCGIRRALPSWFELGHHNFLHIYYMVRLSVFSNVMYSTIQGIVALYIDWTFFYL